MEIVGQLSEMLRAFSIPSRLKAIGGLPEFTQPVLRIIPAEGTRLFHPLGTGIWRIDSQISNSSDGIYPPSRLLPCLEQVRACSHNLHINPCVSPRGNYDFAKAIKLGMKKHDLPFSGEYGFADTFSFWPITQMVAPKSAGRR